MAPPKKYPDELLERATRIAVEARRDPASATGAIKRIADQLGIHPEALRTWVERAEVDAVTGRAPRPVMRSGSRSWSGRTVSCGVPTRWRIQPVVATSSVNFSDGVRYPSVLRGRPLSES